jgi:vancomycin resistance protein VanJ
MAKRRIWICRAIGTLSTILLALLAVCYAGRFDFCAAVTVYPAWCWTAIGMSLAVVGLVCRRSVWSVSLVALWFVFLLVFADSPASLLRVWLPSLQQRATLRVVSLNCASSAEAAGEVAELNPDIVLFQESPARADLERLAGELFGAGGHVHWGVDTSIIAWSEVSIVDVPRSLRQDFVHARGQWEDVSLDVICLRLLPSPTRMDLWSADCWRAYRENRQKRRGQLQTVASYLATLPTDTRVILGSDFNAPAGDAVFRLLRPRLTDAFRSAGRGWGATIINECPVVRIDQIWTSPQLRAVAVTARRTRFSDHRMVVADFELPEPSARQE